MNEIFNPFNLIIIVIAIVIFLRLRNVLGRRTGNERPPYDPYSTKDAPGAPSNDDDSNVIQLPRKDAPESGGAKKWSYQDDPAEDAPVADTPLARALEQIRAADPSFDAAQFTEGASVAYEMIVTAFAKGDSKTLKNLLSAEVFEGFDQSISEREAEGRVMESEFVGIESIAIMDAELQGREARVTVKFVSELIQSVRDKDGEIVDGDADMVREVIDIWTFARDTKSRDPNWKLVATETAN
ncbi:MAG: calcium-binding protein [Hyphomicrobiales bacterium]|nr:MAG: calcium-binding protein [Hyphomicrobiales bacterium]